MNRKLSRSEALKWAYQWARWKGYPWGRPSDSECQALSKEEFSKYLIDGPNLPVGVEGRPPKKVKITVKEVDRVSKYWWQSLNTKFGSYIAPRKYNPRVYGILCAALILPAIGFSAVNIYAPTSQLQAQFISDTTTQYNATITPSTFFPNTYTINLISKKPIVPQTGQAPCDLDKDLALMVQNSTWTYIYAFANGISDERNRNLGTISTYLRGCSDPSNFQNASTSTWNSSTCNVSLGNVSMAIYQQNFSSPTVISLP